MHQKKKDVDEFMSCERSFYVYSGVTFLLAYICVGRFVIIFNENRKLLAVGYYALFGEFSKIPKHSDFFVDLFSSEGRIGYTLV